MMRNCVLSELVLSEFDSLAFMSSASVDSAGLSVVPVMTQAELLSLSIVEGHARVF